MQSFYIVKLCSKGQFVERNLPRWFSFPRTGLVCSRGNLHKYIVVSNCWTNPSSLILDPHLPVSLCIIIQGAMQITCHKKNKKNPTKATYLYTWRIPNARILKSPDFYQHLFKRSWADNCHLSDQRHLRTFKRQKEHTGWQTCKIILTKKQPKFIKRELMNWVLVVSQRQAFLCAYSVYRHLILHDFLFLLSIFSLLYRLHGSVTWNPSSSIHSPPPRLVKTSAVSSWMSILLWGELFLL